MTDLIMASMVLDISFPELDLTTSTFRSPRKNRKKTLSKERTKKTYVPAAK